MDQKTKEDVVNVLVAARNVLDVDDSWTKDALAFTMGGESTDPSDPNAHRFCSLGAIEFVTKDLPENVQKKHGFKLHELGELAKVELAKTMGKQSYEEYVKSEKEYWGNDDVELESEEEYYADSVEDIIPEFNDDEETTKADVIAAFDKTIARLENE